MRVSALKDCLRVVRTRYDEPECEIPIVPRTFCHGASCTATARRNNITDEARPTTTTTTRTHEDFQDTCAFIAHSFLLEFEIFDVVLLPVDACQQELREGELTYAGARQVLPSNEELVALRIPGTMLWDALEHGVMKAPQGGEPRMAGVRFELNPKDGLSNLQTLTSGCRWKPVDKQGTYNVLTVESLAHGAFGYQLLHGGTSVETSGRAAWMHRKLTDMFYKHANYVCGLTDPFRKPLQAKKAKKFEGVSTLVTLTMKSSLRQNYTTISTY
jgi:5'-nucleotidase, C-terminal domain